MQSRTVVCFLCTSLAHFSACGNAPGSLGETPTVSGQITGWVRGAGYSISAAAGNERVKAPIDASGNFSLTLPSGSTMAGALRPFNGAFSGCTSVATASPTTLQFGYLSLLGIPPTGNASFGIVQLNQMAPPQGYQIGTYPAGTLVVGYVYADIDASVSGTQSCVGGFGSSALSQVITYSWSLHRGWNSALVTVDAFTAGTPSSETASTEINDVPAGMSWLALSLENGGTQ